MVSGGADYESPTLWISRPGDLPGNPPEAVAEVFQELLSSEFQGVCLGRPGISHGNWVTGSKTDAGGSIFIFGLFSTQLFLGFTRGAHQPVTNWDDPMCTQVPALCFCPAAGSQLCELCEATWGTIAMDNPQMEDHSS